MNKLRRLLVTVLCVLMVLQFVAVEAVAEELQGLAQTFASSDVIASGYCGGEGDGTNLSWTLTSNGLLTISGDGKMIDFGYRDMAPWNSNNTDILSVEFNGNVANIGSYAFRDCSNLTSIKIPNSVTNIGSDAFNSCTSLISIELPNSITDIGYSHTFYKCSSLTSIVIPDGVTMIGEGTFQECKSLVTAQIPNSVTGIGYGAFNSCNSLATIEIPNSVKYISDTAFAGCKSLTSIIIPNSVTYIGYCAFSFCSNLTSIKLSDGITEIEEFAFWDCTSLTSIIIPKSVTYMANGIFNGCSRLTDIYCEAESKPNEWFDYWNDNCNATVHWNYKGEDPDDTIASGYCGGEGDGTNLRWVLTTDGRLTISGSGAMANYSPESKSPWHENVFSIDEVIFNGAVTTIGSYAFVNASNLRSVSSTNTAALFSMFSRSATNTISIPDGIVAIGENAFAGCLMIEEVVIPESVKTIGRDAFIGCDSLISISLNCTEQNKPTGFDECYSSDNPNINVVWRDDGDTPSCTHPTTEIRNAKPATYTEIGYSGDKYCLTCGELIEKGYDIPMLINPPVHSHSFSFMSIVDDDYHAVYCSCGQGYKEKHRFNLNGICICGAEKSIPTIDVPEQADTIEVIEPVEPTDIKSEDEPAQSVPEAPLPSEPYAESKNPKTGLAIMASPIVLAAYFIIRKKK